MAQHWGYHLIVDAASCNISKITNAEHVANFARELVKRIDMVAYGEPRLSISVQVTRPALRWCS